MSVTFLRSHNNYLLIKDVTNELTACANVKYYKTNKRALLSYFQFIIFRDSSYAMSVSQYM